MSKSNETAAPTLTCDMPAYDTFTGTRFTLTCDACGHQVYVSREAIEYERTFGTDATRSDEQIAASFTRCLACVGGNGYATGEMHTRECAPCAQQMRAESMLTCEGCEDAERPVTAGYIRDRGDVSNASARVVHYCAGCWQIVDAGDNGAFGVSVEIVPKQTAHTLQEQRDAESDAVRSLQHSEDRAYGRVECYTRVRPPTRRPGRTCARRERADARRLSFSDELIAVEDGEIKETPATRATSDDDSNAFTLADSPEDFASALAAFIVSSQDVGAPDVTSIESFSEAGILHNAPYEAGFRVRLANGSHFVVTVTQS